MVTRCMEKEYPDRVAFRYVAETARPWWKRPTPVCAGHPPDGGLSQGEVPDIKGKRVGILSRNCYEYGVSSFGTILAGGVSRDPEPEKDLGGAGI